jgi:AraC family transcriptional regulator
MKDATRVDYLDRVRRVLRFVQVHLDEPLSAERLAGIANVAVFHFHRIFSGLVGESVGEYVRRMRLERAAGELRRTDDQVIEIALRAGYEAHETFRKAAEPMAFPSVLCGVHYGIDEAVSRFVPLREGSQMIEVRLESLPQRRLLAVPHRGDYMGIGAAFARVFEIAAARALLGEDTVSLGIFYDVPGAVPVEEQRSQACVSVPDSETFGAGGDVPDGCEIVSLDGGEFAIGVHKGPYRNLHDSYDWLFGQWLPSSGREAAHAPVHEIYVNNPRMVPEEELITHICLPLIPADPADPSPHSR